MVKVYYYEGAYGHGTKGYPLIRNAAHQYADNLKCAQNGEKDQFEVIELADKGKPFFPNSSVKFSLSHSDKLWVCAMDLETVGVDVQKIKACSYEKIAKRHFTKEEQGYISDFGIEGFFQIWARREALGKYTGLGFFDNMPSFVNSSNKLVDNVALGSEIIRVTGFQIGRDYAGSVCYKSPENPEFVRLKIDGDGEFFGH